MRVVSIQELPVLLPRGRRLIGLDVGSKTVGLALADPSLLVATSLGVLKRTRLRSDVQRLQEIVNKEDVGGAVAGLPVSMDGSEGPQCQRVRQFAHDFLKQVPIPIAFWDERLSTAAVERVLIGEADLSRRRRAQVVDAMAAVYILQGALDAMAHARRARDCAGDEDH